MYSRRLCFLFYEKWNRVHRMQGTTLYSKTIFFIKPDSIYPPRVTNPKSKLMRIFFIWYKINKRNIYSWDASPLDNHFPYGSNISFLGLFTTLPENLCLHCVTNRVYCWQRVKGCSKNKNYSVTILNPFISIDHWSQPCNSLVLKNVFNVRAIISNIMNLKIVLEVDLHSRYLKKKKLFWTFFFNFFLWQPLQCAFTWPLNQSLGATS